MDTDDSEMLILSPLSLTSSKDKSERSYPLFPERKIPSFDEDSGETLDTPHGRIRVVRDGNLAGPAFITFHDLGLNHLSNFKVIKFLTNI